MGREDKMKYTVSQEMAATYPGQKGAFKDTL